MAIKSFDALSATFAGQAVAFTLPAGATVNIPDSFLSAPPPRYPERFFDDFSGGIGNWTAGSPPIGGPRSVTNGIFHSDTWSHDDNHLTTKGGPGRLHLMAYADFQYWNYQAQDMSWVLSDFTNATINLAVRGVSFSPNGSQWIVWITARHPTAVGKNVNWGYITEPRTSTLLSGSWQDASWRLEPDESKWVWGKGADGTIYDTYLSLPESLRNICNIHFPTLGADDVAAPGGAFEMDSAEIVFNRNGPPLALTNMVPLMTGQTTAGVTITGNSASTAWQIASYASLDSSTFTQWSFPYGWLEIDLPSAVSLRRYALTARVGDASQAPSSMTISGWNGSTWIVLNSQSLSPWSPGERRAYDVVPGQGSFSKYRYDFGSGFGSVLQCVRPELYA